MTPGKPKSVKPPAMPPATQPPQEIGEEAMRAGGEERRRLRRRRGSASTRLTRPDLALVPPTIARAGLKTKLGAVA